MKSKNRPKVEFDGKIYDMYQCSQMQRKVERQIRKQKRLKTAYEAAGLQEDATAANIKLRRLNQKYREFSKAAGLPEQRDRIRAYAPAEKLNAYPSAVDMIKENSDGGTAVHAIGKIAVEKYRVVTDKIRTDETVITGERIAHIKEKHPDDFERYKKYISDILKNPQYILKDKSPATAVILNEYVETGERFRLILRLAMPNDPANYKNSVITFMKISERKFQKYLRNKKILYKSK